MKKEYSLRKLKRRPKKIQSDLAALKVPISLRIDSSVLADLKTEAHRLGTPYQTLIGSILHRYMNGELINRKSTKILKLFMVYPLIDLC